MSVRDRATILAEYEVLDSLPEKEFDDIVELASAICGTPISAISLLDLDRQWFKAQVGFDTNQTPIEMSFCRYAAHNPDQVMVVTDSMKDERFKNNPLTTGDPHIRFYAGAPLVTEDGVTIGALCVIDRIPREFSEIEQRMLQILAKRVMKLLEMRMESLTQKKIIKSTGEQLEVMLTRLLEAQNIARVGSWEWDMQTGEVTWSPQIYELLSVGHKPTSVHDRIAWESLIHPEDLPKVNKMLETLLVEHLPTYQEYRVISQGVEIWMLGKSEVKLNDKGEVIRIHGTMQDISDRKAAEKNHAHYTKMLEEMLFDVSHMIRRPLTTLKGLLPVLTAEETNQSDFRQAAAYFYTSLKELDDYTRELNDQLYKSKMNIIGHKEKTK
jgi:PAS domain S-box-containing protein